MAPENEGTERNARGDTPTQAAADHAPDPDQREERIGVDVAARQGVQVESAKPDNRTYTLYHPHGFRLTVRGSARRDELVGRGYTTSDRGDVRQSGVAQVGIGADEKAERAERTGRARSR